MAKPIDAVIRCGSLVEFFDNTAKMISPGLIFVNPFSFDINLQPGGITLETFTILQYCIPAFCKANSKEWRYSLCLPTPLVKKRYLGIILIYKSSGLLI
jgi:hypothetical protein